MHIEAQGIVLYPSELKCLIRFAAKDGENPLSVVHFRIDHAILRAYATNGHRAVEAIGEWQDGAQREGEWTVSRAFLAAALRLMEAGHYVVLEVGGASLQGAKVRDKDTHEDVSELTWPTDAASTQVTFPVEGCQKAIVFPTTERPVRCISLNAQYLADLVYVAGAANSDSLDLFPPRTREEPVIFRFEECPTEWRGAIMPLRKLSTETVDELERSLIEGEVAFIDADGNRRSVKVEELDEALKAARRKKSKRDKQPELEFKEENTET